MSPTQFNHDHQQHQNHHQHAKREQLIHHHGVCPSPLKINKDSHFVKKTSPSSSSSSTSSLVRAAAITPPKPLQQRHPVIIYTHSPKVIHTHPRDFMALVQKLTGLSRSEDGKNTPLAGNSPVKGNELSEGGEKNSNNNNKNKGVVKGSFGSEDSDSSAITTEENCGSNSGDGQVNSCLLPPYFDPPPNPYLTNIPLFAPNSAEFMCSNPPLFNYTDSLFFNPPNMRSSISSSSTLEAMNEFRDY